MQITPRDFTRRFPTLTFSAEGVAALLKVLKPLELAAGERLVTQGQLSDTLYFLCSGRLEITIQSDGTRLVLGSLEPGRWVCEFGFIDPGPAAADVSAQENAKLLALSQESMENLYDASPNTASALLQALSLDLAERLRATSRHTLEKNADNQYTLRQPPDSETVGWLSKIGRKLMGLGGHE